MSHRIDVRIPDDLYLLLREQPGSMTQTVCTAVRSYLCTPSVPSYDGAMLQLLQSEVEDLRVQRDRLQHQVEYLTLPWYVRLFRSDQLLLSGKKV